MINIEGPFQSYVDKQTEHQNFADWLLTGEGEKFYQKEEFNLDKSYTNLISVLKDRQTILKKNFSKEPFVDSILKILEDKKEDLKTKEERLYKILGCTDFEGFKHMWDMNTINNEKEDEIEFKKWMNRHLKLFRGGNLRTFFSRRKGRTDLSYGLDLVQIEFDNYGLEMFDTDVKKEIGQFLQEKEILNEFNGLEKDKTIQNLGKGIVDFIQTKQPKVIASLQKNSKENMEEVLKTVLDNIINESFGSRLARFSNLSKKETPEEFSEEYFEITVDVESKEQKFTSLGSYFLNKDFGKGGDKEGILNNIKRWILEYLTKARALSFNQQEWKDWQDYTDKKRISQAFLKAIDSYFSNPQLIKNKQGIMGELGEFEGYCRKFFALPNEGTEGQKIELLSVGKIKNTLGQQMGSDLVIKVSHNKKEEYFGIQVKNFLQSVEGYYSVYSHVWKMGSEESMNYFYKNIVGFDDEKDQRMFEMLNVNLVNANVTRSYVEKSIEYFLRQYSLELGRLTPQEVQDSSLLTQLTDSKVSFESLFFIMKGELVQSSAIVEGLIQQLKYLIGYDKKNNASHRLDLVYKNTVDRNTSGKIKQGTAYKDLFNKISFRNSLYIQIPSFSALGVFKFPTEQLEEKG